MSYPCALKTEQFPLSMSWKILIGIVCDLPLRLKICLPAFQVKRLDGIMGETSIQHPSHKGRYAML